MHNCTKSLWKGECGILHMGLLCNAEPWSYAYTCPWTEAQVSIKDVSKALAGLVDLRTYAERDKTSWLAAQPM